MTYQVFRPDLLTAIVNPEGCLVITSLLPRKALELKLDSKGVQGEARRQILETWDALHTAGRVPQALGAAVPQPVEEIPVEEAIEGPIDANEAGRRLGVGAARFRQIARAQGLEPVETVGGRRLYDPAEVSELALSRGLDKGRISGRDPSERGEKVA